MGGPMAAAAATVAPSEWIFLVVGLVLAAIALGLIVKQIAVTSGHAAIVGLAIAIAALPYIASFSLSNEGVNITTKQQGATLTEEVKAVGEQQKRTAQSVHALTEAMEAMQKQIVALKQASASAGNPIPTDPEFQKYDDRFFQDLGGDVQQTIKSSEGSLKQLNELQRTFQAPSRQ
ncbi:hypothetical protein [Sinorhizobium meliloti]|uniref:hypothetical protein n=1 Tax=Rhizobium meliloti TaxID=382 RepID=UPI000FDB846E|nr:hypothetical protein [Sinorhizobium meliloti]RVM19656.1 hypothetical protein CN134_03150 [Sinorhizobium meliloti]RVO32494.1 hypothetical protein CN098_10510 [Sinorhizobium meliloti]